MIYLTTDTHAGHKMLVDNGYRPAGFEQTIWERIMEAGIKADDQLIHLGDVSFSKFGNAWMRDLLVALECPATLIRGNHDGDSMATYLRMGFSSVCDGMLVKAYGKNFYFSHEPVSVTGVKHL